MKKLIAVAAVLLVSACASQEVNRSIDSKLEETPDYRNGGQTANAMQSAILESKEITPGQRQQLLDLHAKMAREAQQTGTEMSKLKVVLMDTMLKPKASEKEIEAIRNRLVKLDRQRLHKMLGTLDEVQRILGRRTFEDKRLYRIFVQDENKPRPNGTEIH